MNLVFPNRHFTIGKKLKKRYDNNVNPIYVNFKENVEWAMDFMRVALVYGNKFRALNTIYQQNRKCLTIGFQKSMPVWIVINILNQVIENTETIWN